MGYKTLFIYYFPEDVPKQIHKSTDPINISNEYKILYESMNVLRYVYLMNLNISTLAPKLNTSYLPPSSYSKPKLYDTSAPIEQKDNTSSDSIKIYDTSYLPPSAPHTDKSIDPDVSGMVQLPIRNDPTSYDPSDKHPGSYKPSLGDLEFHGMSYKI